MAASPNKMNANQKLFFIRILYFDSISLFTVGTKSLEELKD